MAMAREQWSVTAMDCDEQWSEHERVLMVVMSATVCQLTIERTQETMTSLKDKKSTRLVLDQNSSKVHGRYTTSLYTF